MFSFLILVLFFRLTTGAQTDDTDILFCEECEYPAEDLYELGEPMAKIHSVGRNGICCNFCDETFETIDSVMKHTKKTHTDKVKQCILFSEGKCGFGDALCWFLHEVDGIISLQEATTFKCKHCDKVFQTRLGFMNHRKDEHSENVPACRNFLNQACVYGSSRCWFTHSKSEKENGNIND